MIEITSRSGEAPGWQRLHTLFGRCRLAFVLEGQPLEAFDAPHFQQVEAEGAATEGIQSLRRVVAKRNL